MKDILLLPQTKQIPTSDKLKKLAECEMSLYKEIWSPDYCTCSLVRAFTFRSNLLLF